MKTLYFECKMGAAGDMLMAALYEICDQKDLFLQTMNQTFSEYGIQISAEESKKCGISGTHMHVMINGEEEGVHVHEHVHTPMITQKQNMYTRTSMRQLNIIMMNLPMRTRITVISLSSHRSNTYSFPPR